MIDKYYTSADGFKDWHSIWLVFAGYALVVAILFLFMFRHKHERSLVPATH
jgi:NHS family xanthosine MFS transporter